ncbi:MAG TPA: hypothetical protein VKD43_17385 [Xanthobacteraceae bacterium]|nr:hypothetical protein [Xanthobacteraceae bacterium]
MTESNSKRRTLFRRLSGRLYGDAALCALIYIGCANADFGRVRASIWTDGIHAWVGRDAARGTNAPISQFYLTDDEILLRDLAYPLIEPPYDRQRWYSVLGEWGMTHYFRPEWYHCDPTAYAAQLMNAYMRSETARYFRLNDDVRNDVLRIDPFVAVARRVLDMDSKREKALSHIAVLSGPEVANAKARIGENFLIIAWVQKSLADRAASYRFGLERLIVSVPSPPAVDVERSLALLQSRIAASVLVTPPDFGITAVVPVPPPLPGRVVSK